MIPLNHYLSRLQTQKKLLYWYQIISRSFFQKFMVPPFQTDDDSSKESFEEQAAVQGKGNSTQKAPPSLKIVIPASSSRKRKTLITSSSDEVSFNDKQLHIINFDTCKGTATFKQGFKTKKSGKNWQSFVLNCELIALSSRCLDLLSLGNMFITSGNSFADVFVFWTIIARNITV